MAYTPPSGSEVAFSFSGASYTPPSGDSVAFAFTATVALGAVLPLTGSLAGVSVIPDQVATLSRRLPLTSTFLAEAPPCGIATAAVILSGSIAGAGHIEAQVGGAVPIRGSFAVRPAHVGGISGVVALTSAFEIVMPFSAVVATTIPLSGTVTGFASPSGSLSTALRPIAQFNAAVGTTGRIIGAIRLNGAIQVMVGRNITMNGRIRMSATARANHGLGGSLSGHMVVLGAFAGTHAASVASTINGVLPLGGYVAASHIRIVDPSDAVFVRTAMRRAEIFTEVSP